MSLLNQQLSIKQHGVIVPLLGISHKKDTKINETAFLP
jgi:hypothetical protein